MSSRSIGRGRCPKCGEEGSIIVKEIAGRYYIYFKHGKRWCYIGPIDKAIEELSGTLDKKILNKLKRIIEKDIRRLIVSEKPRICLCSNSSKILMISISLIIFSISLIIFTYYTYHSKILKTYNNEIIKLKIPLTNFTVISVDPYAPYHVYTYLSKNGRYRIIIVSRVIYTPINIKIIPESAYKLIIKDTKK